jgi:cobalamin synthase
VWWQLLFLCNAAFAYSDVARRAPAPGGGWAAGWQPFGLRAAAFAWLSLSPRALGLLLAERQPRWLFILQNILLIHSSILQTSAARRLLADMRFPPPLDAFRVEQPQRALLLWLAPVLAAASAFQWRDPDRASEAVLLLSALWVAAWALRRFGGGPDQ